MCVFVHVSLTVRATGCCGGKCMAGGFSVPTWLAFNDTRMEVNADDKLICLETLITAWMTVHPT